MPAVPTARRSVGHGGDRTAGDRGDSLRKRTSRCSCDWCHDPKRSLRASHEAVQAPRGKLGKVFPSVNYTALVGPWFARVRFPGRDAYDTVVTDRGVNPPRHTAYSHGWKVHPS